MVEANPAPQTESNDQNQTMAETAPDEEASIYQAGEYTDIFSGASAREFTVRDPHDFSGHIVYNVTGKDL